MEECEGACALPSPSNSQTSGSEPGFSPQYLFVDETKRPRANSDPLGLHICISPVPEIRVTGEDGRDNGLEEDEESDFYLIPPSPRRRANTCPEDMFRTRRGRPPTPPPTDIQLLKNPAGKRFSFNFTAKDLNGISFAHHKLNKVSEEKPDETGSSLKGSLLSRLQDCESHCDKSVPPKASESVLEESLSNQINQVAIDEDSLHEATNNNAKQLTESGSGVMQCSSDSYRPKNNSRDNLEKGSLRAY